eukprot:scpid38548/ scgid1535/ 
MLRAAECADTINANRARWTTKLFHYAVADTATVTEPVSTGSRTTTVWEAVVQTTLNSVLKQCAILYAWIHAVKRKHCNCSSRIMLCRTSRTICRNIGVLDMNSIDWTSQFL